MKKNLLWNTCGSIFYSLCQWMITIIVVHIANYETAGVLSLAMTTSSSFSAISLFSMRNYQVSDVKEEYSSGQYVSSRIVTCVLAFVFCIVYAIVCNNWNQVWCIVAFMIIRVAEAIVDVLHGINQKYDRYDYIGKSYILRGFFTISIFIISMCFIGNLLITLYIMALFNLGIALLYDGTRTGKLEKIDVNLKDRKIISLLFSCVPLVVFTFLLSLENLIPKNVLQNYYGNEIFGIYSTIASPTLIVQLFASVVFAPFLPRFSSIYNDGKKKEFKKLLHKTYMYIVILCIVVTIGAICFGKIGLKILFGNDILKHYYLFMPIVYCTLFTGIIWILSAIVILVRKIKQLLIAILCDFFLCVIIVSPIVKMYGANGCSIVQLITLPILIVFFIYICEVEN